MSRAKIAHEEKFSIIGEIQVFITQHQYADAAQCCVETAGRRMRSIPFHVGAHGVRQYHLAAALVTLKSREIVAGAVPRLAASATAPDDVLFVGDMLNTARRYVEWLDAPARARLAAVQNSFAVALANSPVCVPAVVENLEMLRTLIAVQPDVMRHVLADMPAPEMARMAPAFAIVNNSTFNMKEGA